MLGDVERETREMGMDGAHVVASRDDRLPPTGNHLFHYTRERGLQCPERQPTRQSSTPRERERKREREAAENAGAAARMRKLLRWGRRRRRRCRR